MSLADNYINLRNNLRHHIKVVSEIQASEAPQISAQKIQSLDHAIKALESFYQEYRIIKFCTHIVQKNSPLSRARRVQQQINKKPPKGANVKIAHSIKTYFNFKKEMIASRNEIEAFLNTKPMTLPPNLDLTFLSTKIEKMQQFYQDHRITRFFTNTIYKPFKTTQLAKSLLTEDKFKQIVNQLKNQADAFDITIPVISTVDLDECNPFLSIHQEFSFLFVSADSQKARKLVKAHSQLLCFGTINEQQARARIQKLQRMIKDQGLQGLSLSDKDKANKAFINAVLFGRENPACYIKGSKISIPKRISTAELEEKLSFFNGVHCNEDEAKAKIIKAFEDAEQNHDDYLIANIFANITSLNASYGKHRKMNLVTYASIITIRPEEFAEFLMDA